ncbi:MAG: hypothetical protein V1661_00800 [bacterium]
MLDSMNLWEFLIKWECVLFKRHLELMDVALTQEGVHILEKVKECQYVGDIADCLHEELEGHEKVFYGSMIIFIYAYLEHTLNRFCEEVEHDSLIKLEDMAGKGVKRAQNYLKKVGNFKEPIQLILAKIADMGKIRNKVVHAGGRVKNDDEDIQSCIKRLKKYGVEVNSYKELIITKDYCEECIQDVQRYLLELLQLNNKQT